MVQPVEGLLDLCEGQGVLPAGEWATLKMLETVDHDHQEVFLVETIDTCLLDRTFLEMDLPEHMMRINRVLRDFRSPHFVYVTCATRSGIVQADDLGEPVGSNVDNPF